METFKSRFLLRARTCGFNTIGAAFLAESLAADGFDALLATCDELFEKIADLAETVTG